MTPTITRIIGIVKKILAIFSRAWELNSAKRSAPNERIAPGNFGNWVPPNADPMIRIAMTIKIFSMVCNK